MAVKRERLDNEDVEFITADLDHNDHPDSAYEEAHLEPFFVLRNILEVATEKLEQLNNSQDALSHGIGVQVPLCSPCGDLARQFHETLEKVSRLQMILSEIQVKFMEKIQQNKDVQCQGSSSFWKEVRRQVLLTSFGDDHLLNAEKSDDFEEEWLSGGTIVKSEVADEPNDDDDDGSSFTFPTFPLSSSVLHLDSTSSLLDDEGVNGNLPRSTSAPPPSKNRRKVSQPEIIPRSGKRNSNKWLKKKTTAPSAAQVLLQCAHCTYKTMHMSRFNDHQQVHEDGSEATACNLCGIFVIPSAVGYHRGRCAPIVRNAVGDKKLSLGAKGDKCPLCPYTNKSILRVQTHLKVHEEGVISVPCKNCGVHNLPEKRCNCYQRQYTPKTKTIPLHKKKPKVKKEPEWLTSPDFTGFKKESKHNFNIITLSCNYCPFTLKNSVVGMKKHVKLHDPTSQAVPCLICGAYMLPKSMKLHVGLRHPSQRSKTLRNKMKELTKKKRRRNPDFTVKIKKSKRWYICRKCPYKTIDRGAIDTHAGLHLEGSSAIPCELCNIFVVPEQMEFHQATDHPDPQPKEPIVKITPVGFKCAHCPYETKDRKQSEHHAALHSEGSRGSPCHNCDVYYILNPIRSRHRCGKWKKLTKLRLVEAKRDTNQNEGLSKLPNPE